MCKRTIGFGHSVRFILLLDRRALPAKGVQQFARKFFRHIAATTRTRRCENPTHRQRDSTFWVYFHRHLVGRAADTLRLHFASRGCLTQCLLKDLDRFTLGPIFDQAQRAVHAAASNAFLAAAHHPVNKHRNVNVVITRIGHHGPTNGTVSSRHGLLPLIYFFLPAAAAPPFRFFSPYFLPPPSPAFTPSTAP